MMAHGMDGHVTGCRGLDDGTWHGWACYQDQAEVNSQPTSQSFQRAAAGPSIR